MPVALRPTYSRSILAFVEQCPLLVLYERLIPSITHAGRLRAQGHALSLRTSFAAVRYLSFFLLICPFCRRATYLPCLCSLFIELRVVFEPNTMHCLHKPIFAARWSLCQFLPYRIWCKTRNAVLPRFVFLFPTSLCSNVLLAACNATLPHCSACANTTSCTACQNPYLLANAACLSSCPVGFFGRSGVCVSCSACAGNTYQFRACNATANTECRGALLCLCFFLFPRIVCLQPACSSCNSNQLTSSACSAASDTVCSACSVCANSQFRSVACTSTADTVCTSTFRLISMLFSALF